MAVKCSDPGREFVKCGDIKVCPTQEAPTGPGCYCSEGKYLYPPTNECLDLTDPRCSPPPARPPPVNLCKLLTNSMIPSIVIPLEHPVHTLSWTMSWIYAVFMVCTSFCVVDVPPCVEVKRDLTITWIRDTPITKYEVRDYTGDLVGENLNNFNFNWPHPHSPSLCILRHSINQTEYVYKSVGLFLK